MSEARAMAPAEADAAYGLMRIDRTLLALPVAMLREVIPCPAELAPLPVPAEGLCGAVQLRGTIIPVLDLRRALGMPPAAEREAVIVLMRYDGRLLGLKASAVQGMARVAGSRLHALTTTAAAGGGIATHSFEIDDGVATLLDAARIAALPGVPMVAEPRAESRSERAGGAREPLLLFGCGGLPFGIAAMSVDATVPRTALRASSLEGELCRGVIDHHGHEVPVIDTLRLLGMGECPKAADSAVIVLRFPKGLLGLMLDQVRDIVNVATDDILPLQPLGLAVPARLRGMLAGEGGGQHLLIDAVALQQEELLAALAGLSRPKAAAAQADKKGVSAATAGRPYLTYKIEVETASELTQASEILPYPRDAVPLQAGRDATLGLFNHRGSAVPLVCLCTLLGRTVALDFDTARVLVVEDGGQRVGLVVQALCSIENARWEQPTKAGDAATLASMRGLPPLVEVGVGAQHRTLPRLDLLQLVRALRREAQSPRPSVVEPAAVLAA
jgi:purine-binding chemotaxis protein CheW